ncbi:BQ5605_C008g05280 [Microbotryum silenes-dioicae]|uniref:BQ5605_C008g05280 protein n=1 Tax=Microbotryum silenes-dioicae TaxID=796604 RepID=A0A2X0MGT4_9BASI|nr:BQ5605_C008g05280 [Microbotryum silenes-dioicae]
MSSASSTTTSDHGESTGSPRKSYQMSNKRVVTTPSWARNIPKEEVEYLYDYNAPPPPSLGQSGANRQRSLSSIVRAPAPASDEGSNAQASARGSGDAKHNATAAATSSSSFTPSYLNFNSRAGATASTSNDKSSTPQGATNAHDDDALPNHTWPRSSSSTAHSASSAAPLNPRRKDTEEDTMNKTDADAVAGLAKATHNASSNLTASNGAAAVSAPPTGDRWWTFTLPSRYLDRVHDYVNRLEGDQRGDTLLPTTAVPTHNKEKRHSGDSSAEAEKHENHDLDPPRPSYARQMSMNMAARLAPSNVFSVNHTQTPGWSTPWAPFSRDEDSVNANRDPFSLVQAAQASQSKTTKFENFILNNVFAPLVFRAMNLVLAGCTLGIASHIRLQETRNNVIGIIGTSTLFVIIVGPFAIVHVFATVYIEYFGPPIGIWNVRTKMAYTLLELVFICLWSALLSLAFDDLFTSSLECTSFTPYARYNESPSSIGLSSVNGTVADSICQQQMAQVVLIFLSVMLCLAVLIVSLLRIFVRVSRKV